MIDLPANLPDIGKARLPIAYQEARKALAKCVRIDECKDWADRTAALASYAKQADDRELERNATRIRALAIRRCGELLQQIKKATNQHDRKKGAYGSIPTSRTQAAKDAGMSQDQKNTALRLASIEEDEFEVAINKKKPATITELAAKGTKKTAKKSDLNGRDPKDFQTAGQLIGAINMLWRFTKKDQDRAAELRGLDARERQEIQEQIPQLINWLETLADDLEREGRKNGNHTITASRH